MRTDSCCDTVRKPSRTSPDSGGAAEDSWKSSVFSCCSRRPQRVSTDSPVSALLPPPKAVRYPGWVRTPVACLWVGVAFGCSGPTLGPDAGLDASSPDAAPAPDAAADATRDAGRHPDAAADGGSPPGFALPPPDAPFDYQLGGPYPPPEGVTIVARDRTAPIAAGLYNVCYVNGFQIQPGEETFWLDDHPDLVLRDASGDPVIDPDWDEMLIDVGTPEKRARVAAIVGDWIRGCAEDGFDAVEIDNLDSFSRSGGRLTEGDAVAAMRLFADAAHAVGLAVAQKNAAELVPRRAEMATDFVVAEECNRYSECDVYTSAYGGAVLVIEYRRADFEAGCADFPGLSIVLRDLDLVTPADAGYVYDGC